MRTLAPRSVYALLFAFIAITVTFQSVGAVSLITGFFDLRHQALEPFTTDFYHPVVTDMRDAVKAAGLEKGDTVEAVDGQPIRGRHDILATRWYAVAGGTMKVDVRKPNGDRRSVTFALEPFRGKQSPGTAIFVILLQIVIPFFCLGLGYWVALARPLDLNAWLILIILTFPQSFITVSTFNWWPEWLWLRLSWHLVVQIMAPAALLWLGLYFPERSRIDVRFPWLKWLVLAAMTAGMVLSLFTDYIVWYDYSFPFDPKPLDRIFTPTLNWSVLICILLYGVAIVDKLRVASTADARRRLNVLAAGSAAGLGGTLFIWTILPLFGLSPNNLQWLGYTSAVILLIFPLTLAYVVVVQRAMDVRILVRTGTQYLLARWTVTVLQVGLLLGLSVAYVVPLLRRKDDKGLIVVVIAVLIGLIFRAVFVKRSIFDRLRELVDKRFFREAYNAEVVLSELVERVRIINDPGPLLTAVATRVSEVLHVPRMAVLLRHGDAFRIEHIAGMANEPSDAISLGAGSSAVRRLSKTNAPALLYRDRPEAWFIEATDAERQALDDLRAEVLLPLTGRNKLMGVMVLGPKRSEEPYSPTDLRLLASIGSQTGLGLEVNDLAQSLALEAAGRMKMQREVEIAREVQQRLFPQKIPMVAGLELAGHCRPALEVGGDYYDMIELEDGRLALAVGDVSGKGIGASLLMASLRASLRGMTDSSLRDLARMVRRLNRLVFESSTPNKYATFFFAIFDPKTLELNYVNGGHNAPMIVRQTESLRLEATGAPVGLLQDTEFEQQSLILLPGDVLIAFTDGISEAMTLEDEEWGDERMLIAAQSVLDQSAGDIVGHMLREADLFANGAPQHDDMTLLVLKLS